MAADENNEKGQEKKKISLEEAIKRKLASKKQENGSGKQGHYATQNRSMKSQNTKKPNNQRRRTGV